MSSYLLTGAAGFIGWRTATELLGLGHTVVGLDNLNDYYDVRVKEFRLRDLQKYPNFHFHQVDIENLEKLEPLFRAQHFDAVINLAARAGVRYSMENPHVYLTTNAHGSLNLLEMMRQHGVKQFVLASTSSLYAGQSMPFSETLPVNTPISPYAASKKAAEVMAYSYHHLYKLDVTVLRYFTVYGPAGRPDMSVFRFIKWIDEGRPIELFGDGSQGRDFTFVDDIAHGTVLASQKPLGYEIINLGGGNNPVSINKLIDLIAQELGKPVKRKEKPFHQADMMETWADIAKAERLLSWKPTIGLEEGVRRSVAWYKENITWLHDVKL